MEKCQFWVKTVRLGTQRNFYFLKTVRLGTKSKKSVKAPANSTYLYSLPDKNEVELTIIYCIIIINWPIYYSLSIVYSSILRSWTAVPHWTDQITKELQDSIKS